jgi:hypothetical protein
LAHIAASADGDVVGEELEGDCFEDAGEVVRAFGDVEGLFDELPYLVVAFGGDGDDAAAAGGDP